MAKHANRNEQFQTAKKRNQKWGWGNNGRGTEIEFLMTISPFLFSTMLQIRANDGRSK
jgi:hypothetical protein